MVFTAAALAALGFFVVACGGDGEKEIVIPRSAIEGLERYAFTTDIEVSSVDGDLELTYDAVFQAPDRIQGTFTASGELFEQFGLPSQIEVIDVGGGEVWWREPGDDWQAAAQETRTPFLMLNGLGTPWFYLEAFHFDPLRVPAARAVDVINGASARRVRLDKAGVIGLLPQLTAVGVGDMDQVVSDEDIADVQRNARENMPEDMVIEVWIAEEGGYPVRLVITFSEGQEEEEGFLVFPPPLSVRLQIDITDPDADVDIEPPLPSGG